MADIPLTRTEYPEARQEEIRAAVRKAEGITTVETNSRLATPDDAGVFHEFLSDPDISGPIYTLPRPLTLESVRAFIEDHLEQRERGEGLLFLNVDAAGAIGGYVDIIVWPQWAAGELGGAVGKQRQGQRHGIEGARLGFDWMFDVLGLELLCATAALDNFRTAKLLDGLGFKRKGEIVSVRPDGTERASLVWEVTRPEWDGFHGR